MVNTDIEQLLDGRAHLESDAHSTSEQWRLHLTISLGTNKSAQIKEVFYRTKLTFPSKEDCERWHRDYFSTMLRLVRDDTLSRPFRAAVIHQLIDLFELI